MDGLRIQVLKVVDRRIEETRVSAAHGAPRRNRNRIIEKPASPIFSIGREALSHFIGQSPPIER